MPCYMMHAFLFSDDSRALFYNEQILFLSWRRGRGAGGECPEAKTPYFYSIVCYYKSNRLDWVCSLDLIKGLLEIIFFTVSK